ncbi:MAG: type II toxin-antitoxin system VapC family toxin [Dehalococcoidia bacterium]
MILYADSSALVKALIPERYGDQLRMAFAEAETIITAILTYTEIRTALAQAQRLGRIANLSEIRAQMELLWSQVQIIGVDESLVRRAGDLGESFALRGYDALHLAALTTLDPRETAFACTDNDLREAARRLGFSLLPTEMRA